MVSILVVFFMMVILFGVVGYLRGWQREIIAMAGLIASIALLSQFGYEVASFIGGFRTPDPTAIDPNAPFRQQFWIQAAVLSLIAFFSYQVARLAQQVGSGRLGERLRSGLESRVTGLLFGLINGYLYIGSLWGFLEYRLMPEGYTRLMPLTEPYPFSPEFVTRPLPDTFASALAGYLPMTASPTFWLVVFFAVFFIVIVALI